MANLPARKAAVLGAFVADAAAMPLHWIYDTSALAEKIGAKDPAFFDPPSCPFYQYKLGSLSPYGDELRPILQSITEQGQFDGPSFVDSCATFFRSYQGRLSHVPKLFLEQLDGGAKWPNVGVDDSQAHGVIKVPIMVARYAGSPELLPLLEVAVRCHQQNDTSVAFSKAAAQMLERVLAGSSFQQVVDWALASDTIAQEVRSALQAVKTEINTPHSAAVKKFGLSCALPGCFQGPMHCLLSHTTYADAVRATIMAGGDNCSRSHLVGAFFAAKDGIEGIPAEWRMRFSSYNEIAAAVDKMLKQVA